MGTKTVKWALGQVMLVKAVMDQELYDLIDNNIYVDKFNDSDTITDRNGVTVSASRSLLVNLCVCVCQLFECMLWHSAVHGATDSSALMVEQRCH